MFSFLTQKLFGLLVSNIGDWCMSPWPGCVSIPDDLQECGQGQMHIYLELTIENYLIYDLLVFTHFIGSLYTVIHDMIWPSASSIWCDLLQLGQGQSTFSQDQFSLQASNMTHWCMLPKYKMYLIWSDLHQLGRPNNTRLKYCFFDILTYHYKLCQGQYLLS